MRTGKTRAEVIIGWREWIALPDLGIPAIKAKVDTGARTSTLHAYMIESFIERGQERVRFGVHPMQQRKDVGIFCVSDVVDRRIVTDSGGHRERRYVISTTMALGDYVREIEVTLSNREAMKFRMLLGRTALRRILVKPSASFLLGRGLAGKYQSQKTSMLKRKKSEL